MATLYDGIDLARAINYTGQEQAARNLLIKMNTLPVERIAAMTSIDVYAAILEKYEMIMTNDENILLIERDKMQDFNKIAVMLSR